MAPDFSSPIIEEPDAPEISSSGESDIPIKGTEENAPDDSQRLAIEEIFAPMQSTGNQERAIKRIVFFFEDGKFEVLHLKILSERINKIQIQPFEKTEGFFLS